jgi:hypothetical protein
MKQSRFRRLKVFEVSYCEACKRENGQIDYFDDAAEEKESFCPYGGEQSNTGTEWVHHFYELEAVWH